MNKVADFLTTGLSGYDFQRQEEELKRKREQVVRASMEQFHRQEKPPVSTPVPMPSPETGSAGSLSPASGTIAQPSTPQIPGSSRVPLVGRVPNYQATGTAAFDNPAAVKPQILNPNSTANQYLGKMVYDAGAAFTNLAGDLAGGTSPELQARAQSLHKTADRLHTQAEQYGAAAAAGTTPALRGIAGLATNLLPFFALASVPVAGPALAAGYSAGQSSGEIRRAGMSQNAQNAAMAASILSMGAAGAVGKALGGQAVTQFFAEHGIGNVFARTLERAAVSGLASGTARQVTSGAVKAAGGVHHEIKENARANIAEAEAALKIAETSGTLDDSQREMYQAAIAANQKIVDKGGVDVAGAVGSILFETLWSVGMAGVSYGIHRAKGSTAGAAPQKENVKPGDTQYFRDCKTPEDVKSKYRTLAKQYHPDLHQGDPAFTEIMRGINAEYDALSSWMGKATSARAKTVSTAWEKAQKGEIVPQEEAQNAYTAMSGLMAQVEEAGDPSAATAVNEILSAVVQAIRKAPKAESALPVLSVPKSAPTVPSAASGQTPIPSFSDWLATHPAPANVRIPGAEDLAQRLSRLDLDTAGQPLLSYSDAAQLARAEYPGIPDEALRNVYNQYRDDNRTLSIAGQRVTRAEFRDLMRQFASEQHTPEEWDTIFNQAILNHLDDSPANELAPNAAAPIPAKTEDPLSAVLASAPQTEINGFRFSISTGKPPFLARIQRMGSDAMGGMISDGFSTLWQGSFPTRQAAIDTITAVAQNNRLIDRPVPENPVAEKTAQGYNEPNAGATPQSKDRYVVEKFLNLWSVKDMATGKYLANYKKRYPAQKKADKLNAEDRGSGPDNAKGVTGRDRTGEAEAAEYPSGVQAETGGTPEEVGRAGPGDGGTGAAVPRWSRNAGTEDSIPGVGNRMAPGALRSGDADRGDASGTVGSVPDGTGDGGRRHRGDPILGGVHDAEAVPQPHGTRNEADGLDGDLDAVHLPGTGGRGNAVSDDLRGRGGNGEDRGGELQRSGRGRGKRTGKGRLHELPDGGDLTKPQDGGKEPEGETQTPEDAVKQEIRQKAEQAAKPKGQDFVIPPEGLDLPSGEKARFRANVEAIRLARQLEAEGRPATAEEQTTLSKFVGWGGLSKAFDDKAEKWAKEYRELKDLLSPEEWKRAADSTLNAHYTSTEVIREIWNALESMGFHGGRLLEPSAGIGHFAGAMPENLRAGVRRWTMVELDPMTGSILKALYPAQDVRVKGFQDAKIPEGYMDVAISNVPFGNYGVKDPKYPSNITGSIHNYFIAKMLDTVRPGGMAVAITSSFTMDGTSNATFARKYFSKQADLVGAVRLPNTAFKDNAGTSVVTDILFFKKRSPNTAYQGEPFQGQRFFRFSSPGSRYADSEYLNEYYVSHPEMMLGRLSRKNGMYGPNAITLDPLDDGRTLAEQLRDALSKITAKMEYPEKPDPETAWKYAEKAEKQAGKVGQVSKQGGKLIRNTESGQETLNLSKKDQARLETIIDLRDTGRNLLSLQLSGGSDTDIAKARTALNSLYDSYLTQFGPLHLPVNARIVREDVDSAFVFSLENWNREDKTASKADIFAKNTVTPRKTVTHTDNISDALTITINQTGRIDMPSLQGLTGKDPDTIRRELLDAGLVFLNRDGELESPDTYLSGNVRAKLRDAEALAEGDPDYRRNVEALKKIIPKDIDPEDIKVNLGATWIPPSVYSQFADYLIWGYNDPYPVIPINYNKLNGQYTFGLFPKKGSRARPIENEASNRSGKFATEKRTTLEILLACLNSQQITVTTGGSFDKDATAAAQQKQKEMEEAFASWIWKDEGRRDELAKLYNETMNCMVPPSFDGSHLTIDGLSSAVNLRDFQADAVQRIAFGKGNVLLDHCVGAGKSGTIAAACMKLRQTGVAKKPLIIAPKNLIPQWGDEFLKFFPAAKVLVLEQGDYSPARRKETANRIATGDWDAVILSYEQFRMIPVSEDLEKQLIQDRIDEYERAIRAAEEELGAKHISVKDMRKRLLKYEEKLEKLGEVKRDKDNIDFESLGVDALFVDEAQAFKNLEYVSNMNQIGGLGDKKGTKRADDMLMKTRYLNQITGGRNIVFATATPMMNAIPEIYTMQRYLDPEGLEAAGLNTFDAWAKQFGVVEAFRQQKIGGGYEAKNFLTRYRNIPELQRILRSFMDVVRKLPESVKVPKMKGGARIIVECESSPFQAEFFRQLGERAKKASKGHRTEKGADNMLKIYTDGIKCALSQKMINPSLPFEPEGKIVRCAQNVYDIWQETKDTKGTQIVFLDMSVPTAADKAAGDDNADMEPDTAAIARKESDDAVSVYGYIRNYLIGKGIPAKQIAFIHDANNSEKRKALFKAMNEGRVRVLIGSTGKMGVGMNAQGRVAAMHHINPPHRPGDIEQREGRGLRQGNINEEVAVYVYVTKGSIDTRMWQNLNRKAQAIDQIQEGSMTAREMEGDGEFAVSAAEIASIASGNPLLMEQFGVVQELERLESLKRAHIRKTFDAQKQARLTRQSLAADTATLPRLEADLAAWKDTKGDAFTIHLKGKTYTERKTAGEDLLSIAGKSITKETPEKITEIGSFAGLKLSVSSTGDLILNGQGQYRIEPQFASSVGTIRRLENQKTAIANAVKATKARIAHAQATIPQLDETASSAFPQEAELAKLRDRDKEIQDALFNEKPSTSTSSSSKEDSPAIHGRAEDDSDLPFSTEGIPDGDTAPETGSSSRRNHADEWTASRIGGTDKTPVRLSEIVERIRHDFGINLTTGHLDRGGLRGQYSDRDRGIRTKIAQDLPTMAHELGHHLDHIYQITYQMDTKTLRELLGKLDSKLKEKYKPKELPGEGFAEYLRKYLQNREQAASEYPKTTDAIFRLLSGRDAALLLQLSDEVNAYYSMDEKTAQSAVRPQEEPLPDFSTWDEKFREKASCLYQAWVDSNHGIKRFEEVNGGNAYRLATNAAYADAVAASNVLNCLSDADGRYVGPGLSTVLAGITLTDPEEYGLFNEYLVVRHGPERLAENLRVFADERKNTVEWMENRQAEIEAERPDFEKIADRLYEFQSDFLKTWGVDTGLLSQETADRWAERWNYYVPFNRKVDKKKAGIGAKRGFANQTSTIKKAHGSGLDIADPVDSIITNMIRMINAGIRNNVMREITDSALTTEANALWLEKIPEVKKKVSIPLSSVKDTLKEAVKGSHLEPDVEETVFGVVDGLDDLLTQYQRGKAHGNIITVLKNGQPEWWKINDPLLLESITAMASGRGNAVVEAFSAITRFMSGNITGNNVIWSLTSNSLRDLQTLFTYSKVRNPARVFREIGTAYLNKIRETRGQELDPIYMEYLAMGGGRHSMYTAQQDLSVQTRNLLQRKIKGQLTDISISPLSWVSWTSDVIEMGPRFATYKLMRQNGMDPQEAFFAACDITVNFRRGGILSRQISKFIPFFNATIQGSDKFARWISATDLPRRDRPEAAKRRFLAYIATYTILGVLSFALNAGNRDRRKQYSQLSTYMKNSFWCIPIGDGRYFAIPKPRELAVPSSFVERLLELGAGNEDAFRGFATYAEEQFLPNVAADFAALPETIPEQGLQEAVADAAGGALGSLGIIGVASSMLTNRDFLGRPIVSSALSRLEPRDQYTQSSSRVAYALGRALNVSPAMLDYAGENILGGWWKYPKATFPIGEERRDFTAGIKNQFLKDNRYSTDIVNRLYNHAERSSRAKNSDPGNIDKAVSAKMDSNMTAFYARFHALERLEKDSERVRGMRQTVLDMMNDYMTAVTDNYQTPAQKAAAAVLESPDDVSTCLLTAVQSSVTDGDGVSHTLTAEQYLDYQTLYNRYYWETAEKALPLAESHAEARAILKKTKSVAHDLATNDTLARINAPLQKSDDRYIDLAAYGVTMETYAAAYAKAASIQSLRDRDGKTISNSLGAQIAEMVDSTFDHISGSQRKALLKALGVGQQVLDMTKAQLTRELRSMRKLAAKFAA